MRHAEIPIFSVAKLPEMRLPSSYNDYVAAPHFVSARRAYLGAQRRGVADDHPDANSILGLVRDTLNAPFFPDQEIPLPESTKAAVSFLAETDATAAKAFWP